MCVPHCIYKKTSEKYLIFFLIIIQFYLRKDVYVAEEGLLDEKMTMEILWKYLTEHQGETFFTARGLPFTYVIRGGEMFVDRRGKSITRATFARALEKMQKEPEKITGPKSLNVFGAPYIYAILRTLERENNSMEQFIIAHDLGTSGDKATLFTTKGKQLRSHTVPYDVRFFNGNYAEQDPENWWDAVCDATKAVLEGEDPKKVAAMSFSAQMQGCLLVDRNGVPLRDSLIWADQRAVEEAKELEEKIGADRMYRITGHRVSPSYSIEKLMWLKKHEPENYAKAYKMLQAKDYIIQRATGEFVTDYSDASGTNALDLRKLEWSDEILTAAGIDKDKLPILKKSTDIAGYIQERVAGEIGLPAGTPVVCGGGDGPCSAVGAACIHDGEFYLTFGTSAWIGGTTTDPFIDEDKTLFCFAHVIPGKYMPCGTMQAAGSSYSYIRRALCDGKPYEELNQMIEKSPVGAKNLIFLPYMLGERSPRWNPDTSAAFLGIKPEHEKKDYVRAVIEGIAMNMELILQSYRKQADISDMCLTGGGAKGRVVAQTLADVMNVELRMPDCVEEATAIGAAVIAGVGVGVFDGFEDVKRFLKFTDRVEPKKENVAEYEKLKPIFDEAYTCMLPLYEKLSKL
jgi:xylulokinase